MNPEGSKVSMTWSLCLSCLEQIMNIIGFGYIRSIIQAIEVWEEETILTELIIQPRIPHNLYASSQIDRFAFVFSEKQDYNQPEEIILAHTLDSLITLTKQNRCSVLRTDNKDNHWLWKVTIKY